MEFSYVELFGSTQLKGNQNVLPTDVASFSFSRISDNNDKSQTEVKEEDVQQKNVNQNITRHGPGHVPVVIKIKVNWHK